jgi:hypothetical protein
LAALGGESPSYEQIEWMKEEEEQQIQDLDHGG